MKLNNEQIEAIKLEYSLWKNKMYADHDLSHRKEFGQFFTPPELSVKMLEKFEDTDGTILDPCCGAGNLLAAAIKVGFDPTKVYGIELDESILKIAHDRLYPLGVPSYNIRLGDALDPSSYNFDV